MATAPLVRSVAPLPPLMKPLASAIPKDSLHFLEEVLFTSERLVAITGAGISTFSGIPDYRSPNRPPYKPMSHQEFVKSAERRRRYW